MSILTRAEEENRRQKIRTSQPAIYATIYEKIIQRRWTEMLVLTRKEDEVIVFLLEDGREISLKVLEVKKYDKVVRLGVEAPRTISVFRKEIFDVRRNPPVDRPPSSSPPEENPSSE